MHIFDNLPVPVITLNSDARITRSNQGANQLFEWNSVPEEQPLFTQFLYTHETERFHNFYAATDSTPSLFSTILQLSSIKSKRITIKAVQTEEEQRIFLLHQQDTWNSGCRGVCEHTAILETQYQQNPGGILIVNDKMEMQSFNDTFVTMWGIPKHVLDARDEEASLQCVLDKVLYPKTFMAKIANLYADQTKISTDEIYLKDGRIFYRHSYPIKRYMKHLGRAWYFLDITQLKQAQRQVEKQQVFQKAILENVQDGIIACNSEGKINLMNSAGRYFFGFTQTDPIGLDIDELRRGITDKAIPLNGQQSPLHRALNGETIKNEEIAIATLGGKERILQVNGQPMAHGNNSKIGAVLSMHDITEINVAKEQLQFMAYHDPLTSLPNRRLFHDMLLQNLKQASRNGQKVGVLFLDLDNFKSINDSYGHNAGDLLLKEVAKTLQSCLRDSDLLCRWGGDEFIIGLLENYGIGDIVKVAEKICSTVLQCVIKENTSFDVSVTIGIAICPDHGKDPDRLIRNADVAMYHAKKLGKNRCEVFSR